MNKNINNDYKSLNILVKGSNKKSPQRIQKKIEKLTEKITRTPKRLSKTESLEILSPLAKRLQKTQSSENNKKLDVWLTKKGLIQSSEYSNNKQENGWSSRKLSKICKVGSKETPNSGEKDSTKMITESHSTKNINLNSRSRNISGRKKNRSASQTLTKAELPENISHLPGESIPNNRLFDWLNKKELTPSPKVAHKKQKENESIKYSKPCLNKSERPELKKACISKLSSKVDSTKDKVEKSAPIEFEDLISTTRKLREVSKKRLDDWLIKKEFTLSSKVIDRKQKEKESTKPSRSWLHKSKSPQLKKSPSSTKKHGEKVETNTISPKTDKTSSTKKKVTKPLKNVRSRSKTDSKEKVTKSVQKSCIGKTKPAFKRYNSSDSCELPTFANILNNKGSKGKKVTTTKKEQKALFKKYGVHVPTVDEILRDKESLEKDKCKIEQFIPMNDDSLEFEPFIEEAPQEKENILHCKHLTNQQLLKSFKRNMKYLNNIISGKIKNERHDKYFDKNRVTTNFLSDLTFNTSTILFTYDQKEYLIELLKEAFDPEDKKTQYFFQVLLPELCLKIFMETHKMKYDVAVKHLDKQPIIDN